jgi:Glucodextranase, domain B
MGLTARARAVAPRGAGQLDTLRARFATRFSSLGSVITRRLSVASLLAFVLASCGGADEPQRVCDMVAPRTVAAEVRSAGAELQGSLRPRGDESPGLSVCSYRGVGTNVRVSRDTAPQAPLRYFHRIVEQFEFHAGDPQWEPHLVFGVGDDRRAFGGAGAYWVPAYGQLISLRDERLVVVTLSARSGSDRSRRRAAERLTLRVFGGGEPAERGARRAAAAEPGTTVLTPRDGAGLREGEVLVEGTVTPAQAAVRVAGRPARTRNGVFQAHVPVERGRNRIEIAAAADGQEIGRETLTVKRLAAADVAAAQIAGEYDGHVPNIRGERLDIVRSAFRRIGLRYLQVKLGTGRIDPEEWAACGSRPPAGERPPRDKPLVLLVAKRRLDRTSGTACRGED